MNVLKSFIIDPIKRNARWKFKKLWYIGTGFILGILFSYFGKDVLHIIAAYTSLPIGNL